MPYPSQRNRRWCDTKPTRSDEEIRRDYRNLKEPCRSFFSHHVRKPLLKLAKALVTPPIGGKDRHMRRWVRVMKRIFGVVFVNRRKGQYVQRKRSRSRPRHNTIQYSKLSVSRTSRYGKRTFDVRQCFFLKKNL